MLSINVNFMIFENNQVNNFINSSLKVIYLYTPQYYSSTSWPNFSKLVIMSKVKVTVKCTMQITIILIISERNVISRSSYNQHMWKTIGYIFYLESRGLDNIFCKHLRLNLTTLSNWCATNHLYCSNFDTKDHREVWLVPKCGGYYWLQVLYLSIEAQANIYSEH